MKPFARFLLPSAFFYWALLFSTNATEYSISNASELEALPALQAGDIVILNAGNYVQELLAALSLSMQNQREELSSRKGLV